MTLRFVSRLILGKSLLIKAAFLTDKRAVDDKHHPFTSKSIDAFEFTLLVIEKQRLDKKALLESQ